MAQSKALPTGPDARERATRLQPVRPIDRSAKGSHDDQPPDPVDAESVEDSGPDSGARWERVRDRAREFFGATTRERIADRERGRTTDEARVSAGEDGLDERERLLKLRAEIKLAGERYMQSLRDSQLLVPGFNDEDREPELDAMHRVYMQMMLQACLKPLTRGMSPNSIIQAAGMMITLRMLSPDFREEMGSHVQPLKDKVQERIDARTRSVRSFADRQADQHNSLVDARTAAKLERSPGLSDDRGFRAAREEKKTDRDAYLSKRWQRRLQEMEHRERGNREMFTPESAAMTEVALMENAFWRMRDPEQDSDEVYDSYRAMRKRLRDQMAEDSLDRQEVVTVARMIIGERMASEPELRLMFNGLAHGRIVKAAPHEGRIAGSSRLREVWSGEFDDQLGHPIPPEGMFTLRRPMDAHAHQVQLAETMAGSMLDGLQRDDQGAYAGSIMGYLVGFAARKEGLDTRGLPDVLQRRIDQSESMLASMDIDGMPSEKQQEIYSNAFTDAMEEIGRQHPGVEEALRLSFGDDWPSALQEAVDDPVRFVNEQRMRPKVYQTGPDHPTQPSAGFDWGYTARQADTTDHQPA